MGGLHLAAAKGFGEIAQLLLDSGIAPDMQDKVNCQLANNMFNAECSTL